MNLTRRAFTAAASAVLLSAVSVFLLLSPTAAGADDVSTTDLAIPSPLGDMTLGSVDAPVTVVEYASMTCPHCAAFHKDIFPKLKSEYIDTGKVRFVFREFPLDIIAAAGAMVARCAGKDDPQKYFATIDLLFQNQTVWVMTNTSDNLKRLAREAGLTEQGFSECLASQPMLDGLKATQDHAVEKLKVDSTPTLFVNGTVLKGVSSFEDLDRLIKPNLKG